MSEKITPSWIKIHVQNKEDGDRGRSRARPVRKIVEDTFQEVSLLRTLIDPNEKKLQSLQVTKMVFNKNEEHIVSRSSVKTDPKTLNTKAAYANAKELRTLLASKSTKNLHSVFETE